MPVPQKLVNLGRDMYREEAGSGVSGGEFRPEGAGRAVEPVQLGGSGVSAGVREEGKRAAVLDRSVEAGAAGAEKAEPTPAAPLGRPQEPLPHGRVPCVLVIGRDNGSKLVPRGLDARYRFVSAADLFEAGMKLERFQPRAVLVHEPSVDLPLEELERRVQRRWGSTVAIEAFHRPGQAAAALARCLQRTRRKSRVDTRRIEVLDPVMANVLRNKTPAQRLSIGFSLWDSARHLLRTALRSQYKDWTDQQIDEEVARRLSHGAL